MFKKLKKLLKPRHQVPSETFKEVRADVRKRILCTYGYCNVMTQEDIDKKRDSLKRILDEDK